MTPGICLLALTYTPVIWGYAPQYHEHKMLYLTLILYYQIQVPPFR